MWPGAGGGHREGTEAEALPDPSAPLVTFEGVFPSFAMPRRCDSSAVGYILTSDTFVKATEAQAVEKEGAEKLEVEAGDLFSCETSRGLSCEAAEEGKNTKPSKQSANRSLENSESLCKTPGRMPSSSQAARISRGKS